MCGTKEEELTLVYSYILFLLLMQNSEELFLSSVTKVILYSWLFT